MERHQDPRRQRDDPRRDAPRPATLTGSVHENVTEMYLFSFGRNCAPRRERDEPRRADRAPLPSREVEMEQKF